LSTNTNDFALSALDACSPPPIPDKDTGIANTGASGFYFWPDAPIKNVDPAAPPIKVGTATGQPQRSMTTADILQLPQLPSDFP